MTQINIPFKERFREPMRNGTKVITTRSRSYGEIGDWFNVFGKTFVLISVKHLPLMFAITNWKMEGCDSGEEFLAIWKEIHPRKPIDPNEKYYVHFFKDISASNNRKETEEDKE
jgi:hypothetical protein